jgi:hypothetical protein
VCDVAALGGHIEKLVDELDLALNCGLAENAMASLDHAHDLKTLMVA